VSAKTPSSPSTNRLAGDDRYETAVAIARDQLGDALPTDGLVIASGESPYDALAGGILTTANRPMLLVRKDSIPEAVSDFVADYKTSWATGSKRIYILGGESAISAEVVTAIQSAATTAGSTTPPVVTRLSGDDRYATAKAIGDVAGVTVATDKLILVNGQNWPDALSAGVMSTEKGWPVILLNGTSISGSAEDAIKAYIALAGSVKEFIIIGGPAVVSTSVEEALVGLGVAPAGIRRLAGADRYGTSFAVNYYMYANGILGLTGGSTVALASGQAPYDALVASGWGATKNSHVMLTPTAGLDANITGLSGVLGGLANAEAGTNTTLYILGGRSAVSDAARAGYIGASAATNLTSTLTCPTKGSLSATLTLSGRLEDAELPSGTDIENDEIGAMVSNSAMAPYIRIGSTPLTESTLAMSDLGTLPVGGTSRQTFTVSLPATVAVGNTVTFAGWTEATAVGNYTPKRSIASSSCTIENDTTRPTVTIRAIQGSTSETPGNGVTTSAGARIIVEASENISFTSSTHAGLVKIGGKVVTESVTQVINTSGTGATNRWILMIPSTSVLPPGSVTSDSLALGTVVELVKEGIQDKNGNNPVTDPRTVAGPDAAPAALSLGGIESTASANVKLTSGKLRFTAKAGGDYEGAAGSAWKLVVNNQRGLVMPTVALDATAKQITVVADDGYHTVADIQTAYDQAGLSGWTVGHADTGGLLTTKVSRTIVPATCSLAADTCGESHVTLSLSSNEPITLAASGLSITVNGLATGWVDNEAVASAGTVYSEGGALTAMTLKYSKTITFTTSTSGDGQVAFVTSDYNGPVDSSGNKTSAPVSFTL
jgi:putative cell wall-binding protein